MKTSVSITILLIVILTSCNGTHLGIVDVNAPAVNYIFDNDGIITVTDTSDDIELNGMQGTGFLQSRTLPVGEAGTVAEGLYGYEYRIDLSEVAGILNIVCISSFRIVFGPVVLLDFDGNGSSEEVYVVTTGGLGNISPTSVDVAGDTLTFNFSPGICAGNAPGNGDCSFFFGLVSAYPANFITSEIHAGGTDYQLEARAPNHP
ncbi:MAG: hypothetical protein KAR44_03065 [Candidatus Aegiribacteria sp.]|nr:hypothetical protein [Candidatus Aegiribacteria sp.]